LTASADVFEKKEKKNKTTSMYGNGCDMHGVWSAEIPEQLARGLVSSHFFGVLDSSELKRPLPNLCRIFR